MKLRRLGIALTWIGAATLIPGLCLLGYLLFVVGPRYGWTSDHFFHMEGIGLMLNGGGFVAAYLGLGLWKMSLKGSTVSLE